MPIRTTCIGAYPKPDYLALPDWFNNPDGVDTENPTELWQQAFDALPDAKEKLERAVKDVIDQQISAGVDIPTDGEVPRENYIHYQCRHIDGIDFLQLTKKVLRDGAYQANLPTIVRAVSAREPFLFKDWQRAQRYAGDKAVKITIPGPMTIGDTTADAYYDEPAKRGAALADAINGDVLALAQAGYQHIQIDEPVFARYPEAALDFGFENLERTFHGCPKAVTRTVHMCCGYPGSLDDEEYPKADHDVYFALADAIEHSSIDAISLEDAHRYNDLALLEIFANTTVIFGAVAIAKSRLESVEEIRARLLDALQHIDADRLIAAPDCGLGFLGWELAHDKLKNLCDAAHSI